VSASAGEGRTAIVVDDGIATGATMKAALHATRRANPKRLVLATPVAPPDTLERLRPQVDEVVCLAAPRLFGAIGAFYEDFRQLTDEEVVDLLRQATRSEKEPVATPS
jgi:putative phosphoribosyl transferase